MFTADFFADKDSIFRVAGLTFLAVFAGLGFLLPKHGLYLDNSLHAIAVVLIVWTLAILPKEKPSLRYLPVVMILIPACLFLGTGTLRYFLLVFSLLLVIESVWSKSGAFALAILFTVSPVSNYVGEVFTFPIRLFLSEKAGNVLQATGMNAATEGNTILLNGQPFHVDPTCMGLQMLAVSFLAGIFLFVHFQSRYQKKVNLATWCLFITAVFILNLIGNFFRILLLVRFQILPENPAHEFIGLACVIIYVWIPCYYLARMGVSKYGRPFQEQSPYSALLPEYLMINLLVVAACTQILFIPKKSVSKASYFYSKGIREEVRPGITAFRTPSSLTYRKEIPAFYSLEHNPQVCWRGNGYTLRSIVPIMRSGTEIYTGKLIRNNETLYTAWWFTNGHHQTISQLDWRWRMLRGESSFALINVTAATAGDLQDSIDQWLDAPSFRTPKNNPDLVSITAKNQELF